MGGDQLQPRGFSGRLPSIALNSPSLMGTSRGSGTAGAGGSSRQTSGFSRSSGKSGSIFSTLDRLNLVMPNLVPSAIEAFGSAVSAR